MFLLKWLKEYYDIKAEREANKRELRYCESCETLKLQLSLANREKEALLNRILEKPQVETQTTNAEPMQPILSRGALPFSVKRQALERESRNTAKRLEENKKSNTSAARGTPLSIPEIERELGVDDHAAK